MVTTACMMQAARKIPSTFAAAAMAPAALPQKCAQLHATLQQHSLTLSWSC